MDLTQHSQANEALHRALAQPRPAADLIRHAAYHLAAIPALPLTPHTLSQAIAWGYGQALADKPVIVAETEAAHAIHALQDQAAPAPGVTRGEYAIQIGTLARTL